MFSWEYCEIFKNTYFGKHLQTAASVDEISVFYVVLVHNKNLLMKFSFTESNENLQECLS